MSIQGPDQATIQRCKQQVAWTAESQASLADLECQADDLIDRAAAGKVTPQLANPKATFFQESCTPKDVGWKEVCCACASSSIRHEHCDMHVRRECVSRV